MVTAPMGAFTSVSPEAPWNQPPRGTLPYHPCRAMETAGIAGGPDGYHHALNYCSFRSPARRRLVRPRTLVLIATRTAPIYRGGQELRRRIFVWQCPTNQRHWSRPAVCDGGQSAQGEARSRRSARTNEVKSPRAVPHAGLAPLERTEVAFSLQAPPRSTREIGYGQPPAALARGKGR